MIQLTTDAAARALQMKRPDEPHTVRVAYKGHTFEVTLATGHLSTARPGCSSTMTQPSTSTANGGNTTLKSDYWFPMLALARPECRTPRSAPAYPASSTPPSM